MDNPSYKCAALCIKFYSLCVALFLGGKTEAVPRGPCDSDSEDLQRLEMSPSVSSAEKEPDRGSSMVPPICGEPVFVTKGDAFRLR